ncbi:MAG: helix-turn-helix domain-containing protein [Actinomycetaceae bacterium]
MAIVVRLDVELARRKLGVGEFAELVGLTPANVAVLKNGRAKAIRFSTLEAVCRVLDCQPGDILEHVPDAPEGAAGDQDDVDDRVDDRGGGQDRAGQGRSAG